MSMAPNEIANNNIINNNNNMPSNNAPKQKIMYKENNRELTSE
jgi:hypothetical protein